MGMKAKTIGRHLRESFKSLRRNGWMSFASVSAVTITLLLVGVFIVIMASINKFASDLERDVEIRVHIDLAATEQQQKQLEEQIKKLPLVESIMFSSKEEELEYLIQTMGEEWQLIGEDENPLHDVFVVKTKVPEDTIIVAEQIEKMPHVYSAEYGEQKVERLFHVLRIMRNIGLILVIGLLFTAMFLISNTIKITIFARRREIEIMRLVGATNWFIRWPFIFEGVWHGVLGSVVPVAVIGTGYYYLYEFLVEKLPTDYFLKPLEFSPFIYQLSALLIFIGVFIGAWGSFISVRRFLKV